LSRAQRSPLLQLTLARMWGFLREPEAVFWVFFFPVLMALALGIAFRNSGPAKATVGIEPGPSAERFASALRHSRDLDVGVLVSRKDGEAALRRGRVAVVVRDTTIAGAGTPLLVYDPTRPETRFAQIATHDALERAAGREDRLVVREDLRPRPGARYIDFLIP